MMNEEIAKTVAEAEAQSFNVPVFDGWVQFAHLIDGYTVLKEMGHGDWGEWLNLHRQVYATTGKLEISVIDARVMLFLEARALRFTSGGGHYRLINYLLTVIAKLSGQTYVSLSDAEIEARDKADREMYSRMVSKPGDKGGEA